MHAALCVWMLAGLSNLVIQGSHYILVVKFKDFQGSWSCIFKDQFSTEVCIMNNITAIFNIYFCDHGTVLVDKNKTWQLLANLVLGKIPGRLKDHVVDKNLETRRQHEVRQLISFTKPETETATKPIQCCLTKLLILHRLTL